MQKNTKNAVKILVYGAMLAALVAIIGRFRIEPVLGVKFTLDKFVIFMSGMFLGPVMGCMVGFVGDLISTLTGSSGTWLPWISVPAVFYGLCGGLFQKMLQKKFTLPRLALAYLFPVVIGSILYQSPVLAATYNPGAFWADTVAKLGSRSIQFTIMFVIEVPLIFALIKTGIFTRMGLWKERKPMTAEQAINYIHSFFWKGSIPGLSRTRELLRRMGNPEKKLKFVHIAGTNGKGSTAAMTASILQKAGYRTGLYTSPYIYRFNERMQVNGEQIADEDVAAITEYVRQFAEKMEEKPTEFELVTAIAFEYFVRQKCDIVVLEVGMGGALDSTNVIETPEVAVITNIGLDHTDYLGNTLEEIAMNKAGIFKENGAAVIYRGTPGVEAVFEQVCAEKNVTLKKADFDSLVLHSHSLEGQVFDCGDRKNIVLPLLGDHQLHNASVVLSVADTLIAKGWNITEENIYEGIRDVSWPGRFDIVGRDPLFIIDGGHNPQCIDALVKNIQDYLADKKIIALTGVLADKDYGEMYRPMLPYIQEFVCITPPNPRKLDAAELAEHLRRVDAIATPCQSIEEGVRLAIEKAGNDGVVLCFGSLYTIGDIKNALHPLRPI